MSFPLRSRQPASIEQAQSPVALRVFDDEGLAVRSAARLLVTASVTAEVQAFARRIHAAGIRAGFPFLETPARELPTGHRMLRKTCADRLDDAAGGTLLITDVEEMPAPVQKVLVALLTELELARAPSAAVRLISGTTVSLLDRIAAGTFAARLFYQLNIIHLMVGGALQESTSSE